MPAEGRKVAVSSSQPRYQAIADSVRELIRDSAPGDLLPSDAELCDSFAVSRMTARQAVQVLVNEGLVYRRRGQGTFIAAQPVPRVLGSPLSFTESMRRQGLQASSRVLEATFAFGTPEDAEALELPAEQRLLILERLRLADGEPMAIERAALVPDLVFVLGEDLENGSLHAAMAGGGYRPTTARAHVSARLADPRERQLLDLPADGVVLCERRVILGSDGRPLERTETRYAADRYSFELLEHREGNQQS